MSDNTNNTLEVLKAELLAQKAQAEAEKKAKAEAKKAGNASETGAKRGKPKGDNIGTMQAFGHFANEFFDAVLDGKELPELPCNVRLEGSTLLGRVVRQMPQESGIEVISWQKSGRLMKATEKRETFALWGEKLGGVVIQK